CACSPDCCRTPDSASISASRCQKSPSPSPSSGRSGARAVSYRARVSPPPSRRLGLAVGSFVDDNLAASRMFAPALHLLLSIPKSIFLPVFIFAFGIGFLQKVIFAVTLAFFIVVLSGIAAARSVPAGLVTAARSFGASRAQIYLR